MLPYKNEHQSDKKSEFTQAFLKNYISDSAFGAMELSDTKDEWIMLGYRGMTPEEANDFSKSHFKGYIKKGQKAFKDGQFKEALALFENGISIANEIEKYQRYLPTLYQYGRESAYRIDNLKKAAGFAQALVEVLEENEPDTEKHAEALLASGLINARLEQYEKAVPALEEAVEIMANMELGSKQLSVMIDLGVVLENATMYDKALNSFNFATSLSKTLNKDELLAMQYASIGRIYDLRLSQYAVAIQNYKKALDIYKNIYQDEDTLQVAQSLLDIGRCYRLMGNFIEADKHYLEAMTTTIKNDTDLSENQNLKAKIIIEQANNAWFQARYEEAFRLQRKAFQMSREQDMPLVEIISRNTSGLIWWTLGNHPKALGELDQALIDAKTLKTRDDEVATTLNNIGIVFREMGQYSKAMAAFDEALEIDTRIKSRWAVAYDLRNKALTYLKMDQPQKAVPLFKKAYEEANAIGNRINEAKALLGLGEAFFTIENTTEAEETFEKALALSRSMLMRETEWRSIYGLAKIKLKYSENKEEAEKLLFQAVDVIEGMRSEIKIEQLKDSFIDNKLSVYETLVELLADTGKVVEAFELAERSRARNFIDLLGNQQLSLGSAIDQELYDRQATIRARIKEHEALLSQSTEKEEQDVYSKALERLNDDYNNLLIDMQAENPELSSLVSVQPVSADNLLDMIEPDVALLSYYVLSEELFCWIIRPGSGLENVELVRTPVRRKTLDQSVLSFRRMIQNLDPLENQSEELFNILLAPVMPGLKGVKKLGIIPHGSLHYLSFATLADQREYLIDNFSLFYLPSASVLNYTLEKRSDVKNHHVLAVGNPDLGDPLLDLPFAEHEVDSIKWNFPDIALLTNEKATESWVAENIEKFGIIHLASHGEFDPINPLFSAIMLSGSKEADDTSSDGNLEASEVFGLEINADMVVLSACQTGLGKITAGDDVIGLNRAFFYAGTHTVVSSLWRVSDISTAVLIKQFYRQYLTHNKADSLRLAILHVKKMYPHPGYWGAFTLVGDYF